MAHVIEYQVDAKFNIDGLDDFKTKMASVTTEMNTLKTNASEMGRSLETSIQGGASHLQNLRTQTEGLTAQIGSMQHELSGTGEEVDRRVRSINNAKTESSRSEMISSFQQWMNERQSAMVNRGAAIGAQAEMFGLNKGFNRGVFSGSIGDEFFSTGTGANMFNIADIQKRMQSFGQEYIGAMQRWYPKFTSQVAQLISGTGAYGGSLASQFKRFSSATNDGGAQSYSVMNSALNAMVEKLVGEAGTVAGQAKAPLLQPDMFRDLVKLDSKGMATAQSKEVIKTMLQNAIVAQRGVTSTSGFANQAFAKALRVVDENTSLADYFKGGALSGLFDSKRAQGTQETFALRDALAGMISEGKSTSFLSSAGVQRLQQAARGNSALMQAMIRSGSAYRTSGGAFQFNDNIGAAELQALSTELAQDYLARINGQQQGNKIIGGFNIGKKTAGAGLELGRGVTEGSIFKGRTRELIDTISRVSSDSTAYSDKLNFKRAISRTTAGGVASEDVAALNTLYEMIQAPTKYFGESGVSGGRSFIHDNSTREGQDTFLIQSISPFVNYGANNPSMVNAPRGMKLNMSGMAYNGNYADAKTVRKRSASDFVVSEKRAMEQGDFTTMNESQFTRALGINHTNAGEYTPVIKEINYEGYIGTTDADRRKNEEMYLRFLENNGVVYDEKTGTYRFGMIRDRAVKRDIGDTGTKSGTAAQRKKVASIRNLYSGTDDSGKPAFTEDEIMAQLEKEGLVETVYESSDTSLTDAQRKALNSEYVYHIDHGQAGTVGRLIRRKEFEAVERNWQDTISKPLGRLMGFGDKGAFGSFWGNGTTLLDQTEMKDFSTWAKFQDSLGKGYSPGVDISGAAIDFVNMVDQQGRPITFESIIGRMAGISNIDKIGDNPKIAEGVIKGFGQVSRAGKDISDLQIGRGGRTPRIAAIRFDPAFGEKYGFDDASEGIGYIDSTMLEQGTSQVRGGLGTKGMLNSTTDMIRTLAQNFGGRETKLDNGGTRYEYNAASLLGDTVTTLIAEYDKSGKLVGSNYDAIMPGSMLKNKDQLQTVFNNTLAAQGVTAETATDAQKQEAMRMANLAESAMYAMTGIQVMNRAANDAETDNIGVQAAQWIAMSPGFIKHQAETFAAKKQALMTDPKEIAKLYGGSAAVESSEMAKGLLGPNGYQFMKSHEYEISRKRDDYLQSLTRQMAFGAIMSNDSSQAKSDAQRLNLIENSENATAEDIAQLGQKYQVARYKNERVVTNPYMVALASLGVYEDKDVTDLWTKALDEIDVQRQKGDVDLDKVYEDIFAKGATNELADSISKGKYGKQQFKTAVGSLTKFRESFGRQLGENGMPINNKMLMGLLTMQGYEDDTYKIGKGAIDWDNMENALVSYIRSPTGIGQSITRTNYAPLFQDVFKELGITNQQGLYLNYEDMQRIAGADWDGDMVKSIIAEKYRMPKNFSARSGQSKFDFFAKKGEGLNALLEKSDLSKITRDKYDSEEAWINDVERATDLRTIVDDIMETERLFDEMNVTDGRTLDQFNADTADKIGAEVVKNVTEGAKAGEAQKLDRYAMIKKMNGLNFAQLKMGAGSAIGSRVSSVIDMNNPLSSKYWARIAAEGNKVYDIYTTDAKKPNEKITLTSDMLNALGLGAEWGKMFGLVQGMDSFNKEDIIDQNGKSVRFTTEEGTPIAPTQIGKTNSGKYVIYDQNGIAKKVSNGGFAIDEMQFMSRMNRQHQLATLQSLVAEQKGLNDTTWSDYFSDAFTKEAEYERDEYGRIVTEGDLFSGTLTGKLAEVTQKTNKGTTKAGYGGGMGYGIFDYATWKNANGEEVQGLDKVKNLMKNARYIKGQQAGANHMLLTSEERNLLALQTVAAQNQIEEFVDSLFASENIQKDENGSPYLSFVDNSPINSGNRETDANGNGIVKLSRDAAIKRFESMAGIRSMQMMIGGRNIKTDTGFGTLTTGLTEDQLLADLNSSDGARAYMAATILRNFRPSDRLDLANYEADTALENSDKYIYSINGLSPSEINNKLRSFSIDPEQFFDPNVRRDAAMKLANKGEFTSGAYGADVIEKINSVLMDPTKREQYNAMKTEEQRNLDNLSSFTELGDRIRAGEIATVFDLETSGKDTSTALILQMSAALMGGENGYTSGKKGFNTIVKPTQNQLDKLKKKEALEAAAVTGLNPYEIFENKENQFADAVDRETAFELFNNYRGDSTIGIGFNSVNFDNPILEAQGIAARQNGTFGNSIDARILLATLAKNGATMNDAEGNEVPILEYINQRAAEIYQRDMDQKVLDEILSDPDMQKAYDEYIASGKLYDPNNAFVESILTGDNKGKMKRADDGTYHALSNAKSEVTFADAIIANPLHIDEKGELRGAAGSSKLGVLARIFGVPVESLNTGIGAHNAIQDVDMTSFLTAKLMQKAYQLEADMAATDDIRDNRLAGAAFFGNIAAKGKEVITGQRQFTQSDSRVGIDLVKAEMARRIAETKKTGRLHESLTDDERYEAMTGDIPEAPADIAFDAAEEEARINSLKENPEDEYLDEELRKGNERDNLLKAAKEKVERGEYYKLTDEELDLLYPTDSLDETRNIQNRSTKNYKKEQRAQYEADPEGFLKQQEEERETQRKAREANRANLEKKSNNESQSVDNPKNETDQEILDRLLEEAAKEDKDYVPDPEFAQKVKEFADAQKDKPEEDNTNKESDQEILDRLLEEAATQNQEDNDMTPSDPYAQFETRIEDAKEEEAKAAENKAQTATEEARAAETSAKENEKVDADISESKSEEIKAEEIKVESESASELPKSDNDIPSDEPVELPSKFKTFFQNTYAALGEGEEKAFDLFIGDISKGLDDAISNYQGDPNKLNELRKTYGEAVDEGRYDLALESINGMQEILGADKNINNDKIQHLAEMVTKEQESVASDLSAVNGNFLSPNFNPKDAAARMAAAISEQQITDAVTEQVTNRGLTTVQTDTDDKGNAIMTSYKIDKGMVTEVANQATANMQWFTDMNERLTQARKYNNKANYVVDEEHQDAIMNKAQGIQDSRLANLMVLRAAAQKINTDEQFAGIKASKEGKDFLNFVLNNSGSSNSMMGQYFKSVMNEIAIAPEDFTRSMNNMMMKETKGGTAFNRYQQLVDTRDTAIAELDAREQALTHLFSTGKDKNGRAIVSRIQATAGDVSGRQLLEGAMAQLKQGGYANDEELNGNMSAEKAFSVIYKRIEESRSKINNNKQFADLSKLMMADVEYAAKNDMQSLSNLIFGGSKSITPSRDDLVSNYISSMSSKIIEQRGFFNTLKEKGFDISKNSTLSAKEKELSYYETMMANGGMEDWAQKMADEQMELTKAQDAKLNARKDSSVNRLIQRQDYQRQSRYIGLLGNNVFTNAYQRQMQTQNQLTMTGEQLDYREAEAEAEYLQERRNYRASVKKRAAELRSENSDLGEKESMSQARSEINEAGGRDVMDAAKKRYEKIQEALESNSKESSLMSGFGGFALNLGMMGASFAFNGLKKLAKEALDFSVQWDTAMTKVAAKSGLGGEALQKLGDTIEDQATTLNVSSVDLAKTYKDLFAAGFTTDNIEEAAEAITKFSIVTGQNGTQAVKQLSQMVNSGLTSSLEESMDKLTAISDLTAATPADISKVYSKMAAMGTGTGMSEDQTMALATFASESLGGSASVGNDLGVILSRLGKVSLATTSTKEGDVYTDEEGRRFDISSLKSLEKTTGISFLGENGQRNPFEVLQEVANNWQDMSDMQRNAFANIVGGSSGRQSNTFMSLMNAWSNDPEKMQTYMAALQNSEGTVNKQYEAQTNTVDYAKQKAKSAFTDWASDIIGTTWPDLQKQFYNGISNIFGSDSFTSSMANPFESQIDTVDTYISFLDGIKDKYDELGEIELSNIDASEVTSAIASISSAFPQLATSADGAITSVAQLVGLLEQLITLKNQLSGEQTESNAMNADYQKIGEQYIQQMTEAELKKSGYSAFTLNDSAKKNWQSVGNAFFNSDVSTDSNEYKVKQMLLSAALYTGNTWSDVNRNIFDIFSDDYGKQSGIAADMKAFIEGGFDTSTLEKGSPLEQTLNALFADYQSYLSSKNGGSKYTGFMNTALYDLLGPTFLTGFYTNEQYNQDTTSAARTAAEALFTNFQLGTYTGMDETLKEATIQYIQDNYVKQNGTWDNTMYTNFMKDQNSPIYRYLTETTGKLDVSQYQQDQLEADNYQYYMMDADGNVIPLYGGTAKEALTYANEKYAGNVTPEQLSQLNNMYDAATTAYNLKVSSYKNTWGLEPTDELKLKYAQESGFDKFIQLGFDKDRFLEQGAVGYKEMFLGSAPTTTIDYGQIYSRDTNETVATNFADIVNTNLQTESGQKDAKRNMLNYIAKYGVDAFLASTRNTDRTLWDNQGIYASLISGNEELGLMFKSIINGDQSASSIGADLVTTLMKDVYGSDVGTEVSGLYSSVGKYSKALARQKRYNAGIIGKSDLNEIDSVLGTTTQWSNENEAAATMALYDQYLREQEASITATSSQLFNNVLGENAMFASRAQAESVINNRDSEDVTADMVAAAEAYIKVKDFADAIGAKDLGNGEWSFDTIMPSVTNPLMEAIVGKTYLANENKANLQTLLLSGTNFATAFAGEVDEEGIQNALLSFGGSDLETYLKYMQAKAGGADITSDQDYIDARNALYDKAYSMSTVDQGYIGVQLAKDMQNEDGTFKTAEQVNALIDANEQYRIFIANNQAARSALNDFSEGQIEASEATLKVQKAVNKDAESVAALTKKSTEARQAAERANYYLQKAKAGTLSTKTESTDKDGKDKQAVKEGKEVASILGIKEDTLSKFTQKQLEAMLQVQTAGLEQAYTDSLTSVIQDSFDNAMTTSTNELGETVYEAPGIKIKAGETQVIGLAEASGILGEMGYAAVSSEIAAWCANGGEGHLVITGGENSVKVVAEGSVTGGASGGSSSSSGGGGGGGSGKSKYAKAVEKWKSKIATSEHLIKMVKSEETKYEDAGNYAALNNMVELENVANVQQIKEYEAAIAELKPMMSKLKKDSDDWITLRDAIRGFEESIADLNNTIEENKRKLRENREEMRQTRTELENMIKDAIEANEQSEENMLAGTVSMQDLILDALRARYQAEWDLVKEDLEKKKEALEEEKSLIEERLQARKDAESEADQYSKLAELQNQLALVSMDTTMSSQAAELRNQIAELQNNLAWKQAETLTEMATTNIDKQIEGIDQYIEDEDERVQSYIDNANNFSLQVYEILEGSSEEIMQWLKNNSEDYNKLLVHAQEQQLDTWEDTYKQMMGITDTYWDLIGDIISGGWGEIMQYMQTTDEYINASATGKLEMLYEWQTKYEEYIAAFEGTQLENGYDDYLSIIEEAIDSGDLELASKYLGAYVELMNGDAEYEHTDVWEHKKTGKSDGYSTTTTESISSGTEHTTSTDIPSTILNSVDELSNMLNYDLGVLSGDISDLVTSLNPLTALATNFLPYTTDVGGDMFGTTNNNIGDINITINQAELSSDEAIETVAEKVGNQFLLQLSQQSGMKFFDFI